MKDAAISNPTSSWFTPRGWICMLLVGAALAIVFAIGVTDVYQNRNLLLGELFAVWLLSLGILIFLPPSRSFVQTSTVVFFLGAASRLTLCGNFADSIFPVIADCGSVLVLLSMLHRRGQSARWAILYALAPIALAAFGIGSHSDAYGILLILLALEFHERKWHLLALTSGCALTALHGLGFLIIPVVLRDGGWKRAWVIPVLMAVAWWFMEIDANAVVDNIRFPGYWSGDPRSWPGIGWAGLVATIGASDLTGYIGLGSLILWSAVCWGRRGSAAEATQGIILGTAFLFPKVPEVRAMWLLPLAVLMPGRPWMLLSLTLCFGISDLDPGTSWGLVWGTFLIYWLMEQRPFFTRLFRETTKEERPPWPTPTQYDVVIPVLNEEKQLRDCIEQLRKLNPAPESIVVSDGGSTDRTREIASELGVDIVESSPGRGHQVRAAVERGTAEVVVVMHADLHLEPDAPRRMLNALTYRKEASGGAIGVRFDSSMPRLRWIELLNDVRVVFMRMSFGDQVQFYRRDAIEPAGGFPDLPLMEDVELSFRMNHTGATVYLWGGAVASARDWTPGFIKGRMGKVYRLILTYRWRRLFGKVSTEDMYEMYYVGTERTPNVELPTPYAEEGRE